MFPTVLAGDTFSFSNGILHQLAENRTRQGMSVPLPGIHSPHDGPMKNREWRALQYERPHFSLDEREDGTHLPFFREIRLSLPEYDGGLPGHGTPPLHSTATGNKRSNHRIRRLTPGRPIGKRPANPDSRW